MRKDLPSKRNVVPIGSREWRERQLKGYEPDWRKVLPVGRQPAAEAAPKPPLPDAMRQHLRKIGRRGGLERCRNYARRSARGWLRFGQLYRCDPSKAKAGPVVASPEVRRHLRALASLGGRARARKYNPAQLKAWAAKGGHAKAAKSRQAAFPAQSVAGKQEWPGGDHEHW